MGGDFFSNHQPLCTVWRRKSLMLWGQSISHFVRMLVEG